MHADRVDAQPTRRVPRRALRVIAVVVLVVMVGLVGLLGVLPRVGFRAMVGTVTVDVWNVSPGAITIVIDEQGPNLFPNTYSHVIQPWHQGVCFAHLGLDNGHIKLTISGSNVSPPVTFETTTPASPSEIGIQIDTAGHVQFGGTFPADGLPCEGGGY